MGFSSITLPETTDPALFIVPASPASRTDNSALPTSLVDYLDGLPTVREQFYGLSLATCLPPAPPQGRCTTVMVESSTSCSTISGYNRSSTPCVTFPVTNTVTLNPSVVASPEAHTVASRATAASLLYATSTSLLQDSGSTNSIPDDSFTTEDGDEPDKTNEEDDDSDNNGQGSSSAAAAEDDSSESEEDAQDTGSSLIGAGSATPTSPAHSGVEAGTGQDDDPEIESGSASNRGSAQDEQQGSDDPPSSTGPQQGSQSASGQTSDDQEDSTDQSDAGLGTGNLQDAINEVVSKAVASQQENSQVANNDEDATPLAFVFQGQTITAGDTATFGGIPISGLPNQEGIVIDDSQTVSLPDVQATTLRQEGEQPVTVSRSGSAYVVDGQTVLPDQAVTAAPTTAFLAQSTGVLYVNGIPTTLGGPAVTLGGSAYTAVETPESGDDLGGYINSGIGGNGTSNPTDVASFTDSAAKSTGAGSLLWIATLAAFWAM